MSSHDEDAPFLSYRDAEGNRQDADVHAAFLENPMSELYFTLSTIRQHVNDGNSLADSVALFGTADLKELFKQNEFTVEDIDEALLEYAEFFKAGDEEESE